MQRCISDDVDFVGLGVRVVGAIPENLHTRVKDLIFDVVLVVIGYATSRLNQSPCNTLNTSRHHPIQCRLG